MQTKIYLFLLPLVFWLGVFEWREIIKNSYNSFKTKNMMELRDILF